MPIIGDYRDIQDGLAYAKQGNYLMAAVCFSGLIPFVGDAVGATVKALKGCDRLADVVKFTTKVTAKTLVFSYGTYEFGSSVLSLYNRHVVNGEAWNTQSTLTALQGALGGALAWTAGRSITDDIMNMDSSLITGSSWCFVAGTLVHTSEGTTPIEEIEPGDYVLAYDEETGESGYQKVVRLFRNTTDELAHVIVASGDLGEAEEIICTPGHKFYVEGEWIAAGELEAGDVLTLSDRTKTRVLDVIVEELETPEIIYNFDVENWHNYYVAGEGVLVHNTECRTTGSKKSDKSGSDVIKNNLVNKVKDIRAQMPNTSLAKRGNVAVADVDVPGIKNNFVAHSKINAEFDKGADVANFSYLKPENERFFTSYVDDKYPRYHDTEAKILEDIASQITDPNISGTINLYSELSCCKSCSNVILEFRRVFPNIKLNIFVE